MLRYVRTRVLCRTDCIALHQLQVHQRYNEAMSGLDALKQAAEGAAARGDSAGAARFGRELWAQGARKYCLLRTWQKVGWLAFLGAPAGGCAVC